MTTAVYLDDIPEIRAYVTDRLLGNDTFKKKASEETIHITGVASVIGQVIYERLMLRSTQNIDVIVEVCSEKVFARGPHDEFTTGPEVVREQAKTMVSRLNTELCEHRRLFNIILVQVSRKTKDVSSYGVLSLTEHLVGISEMILGVIEAYAIRYRQGGLPGDISDAIPLIVDRVLLTDSFKGTERAIGEVFNIDEISGPPASS